MNVLVLDVETTISNKGNPFDLTNKLVCIGMKNPYNQIIFYQFDLPDIQAWINEHQLIIAFNAKFDLHWLRKIGINISKIKVWDCQLAEFLLSNQTMKYPSLDEVAALYGLGSKIDTVKLEFWDKGIDTDQIPRDILSEYLTQDLVLTQQIYEEQCKLFGVKP